MEQRIRERYHAGILEEAMQRYGIEAERIHALDAFESYIYEYERDDGDYILRISHSFRRSAELIAGEVDWINYLADGGVAAARAVTSLSGKLVEAVPDGQGEYFLATAFVRAAGQKAWELWNPELYQPYGRLLGSMHVLAQNYQPADRTWKRPEWDDDSMEFVELYLPDYELLVKQKYRLLCDHLHAPLKIRLHMALFIRMHIRLILWWMSVGKSPCSILMKLYTVGMPMTLPSHCFTL